MGIATTIAYKRAIRAWNRQSIHEIITIHQMYRVHVWLVYLKLYLAQSVQTGPRTTNGIFFNTININDDIHNMLRTINIAPAIVVMILRSIGKLETDEAVYHCGIVNPPTAGADLVKYWNLVQTPENIREALEFLANADNPLEQRVDYVNHNCLPGALFNANHVLTNADRTGLQNTVLSSYNKTFMHTKT